MEWMVRRVCRDGRIIGNWHLAAAQQVRGRIVIEEAQDEVRKRQVRVARVVSAASSTPIPPLYDVQLLASIGGQWSLTGYERLPAAGLAEEAAFQQSWILTGAPDEDLAQAEAEVIRMHRLLLEHGINPKLHPTGNIAPPPRLKR